MMRGEGKKTVSQLIINTLMTGKTLRARDVSSMVSEAAGKEIKVQDVSNMLYRISDDGKCALGNFVNRKKQNNRYVYSMVDEALNLSEKEAYGLYLKVGKGRYTLDSAVEDHPELQKYVKAGKLEKEKEKKPGKKRGRKPGRPPKIAVAVAEEDAEVPATVETPEAVGGFLADVVKKIAGSEGLNINLNVTFKFGA